MKVQSILKLAAVISTQALVLAVMLLPNLSDRGPARTDAPLHQIAGIESALGMFAIDHDGRYPTGLRPLIERPSADPAWHGPYLRNGLEAAIDKWGSPFRHELTRLEDGRERMRIGSLGPDKVPDTGDDITVEHFVGAQGARISNSPGSPR